MPHDVTLRGPVYTFACYGVHEAKQLGLIDSWEKEGSHAPVSTVFEHGEGKLLADWVAGVPDALLVATGRYQITVYRPKSRLCFLPEDEAPLLEDEPEASEAEEEASAETETQRALA
ncbi:MAG: hypothetical protein WCH57_12585 [Verrucomicrobiota bacterium]